MTLIATADLITGYCIVTELCSTFSNKLNYIYKDDYLILFHFA